MLLKISVLVFLACLAFNPGVANSQQSNSVEFFLGTNQGLFKSVAGSTELVKVPGLQVVGGLRYNPKAQALFVFQQPTPSSINNFVSVSFDQAKSWETIHPSDTGLKYPNGSIIDSFGDFNVSDSGIFVAAIGYGRIAVRNSNKTWQTLNLQTTITSMTTIGDTLYLPSVKGYEGKLVVVDLTNPTKIASISIAGITDQSSDWYVLSFGNGNLIVGSGKQQSLINPKNYSVITTIDTGRNGPHSDEGLVLQSTDGSWQFYDASFKLIGNFESDKRDLAYQYANGCVWILRTSSFGCEGKQTFTLPVQLDHSERNFGGAVFLSLAIPKPETNATSTPKPTSIPVPTATPVTNITPKLDPVLFVSGLGGGNDGDLFWEGKNPDKVTLVTKSGLAFSLSISVWTTGQQGYFLTFDHYFTQDICLMAEMVGRSVDYIRTRTHADKVDLIGYSMGGLLSRCFVENLVPAYSYDNSVDELLLVAVPNNGSFAATLLGPFIFIGDLIKGFQSSGLTIFSPYIKRLNSAQIPQSIKTTVIYGGGLWLPILERNDGLVSASNTRLEPSVQESVRYIYLSDAVHANRFALGSKRYPILEDQIHLTDTIKQMGEK